MSRRRSGGPLHNVLGDAAGGIAGGLAREHMERTVKTKVLIFAVSGECLGAHLEGLGG